ncbi:hypothetical protein SAMN05661080_03623 [Modestobacter sp. DSM 44400]|uniref:hypothetical protein n=1 Tax=Modestobacter sp. DSM 44400 TaxID=1550230 RepID=UPI00089C760A|nr:hypothetical protein [Modestobacter sp. DSM 44400]SDY48384.1 hypothetical protein SAMN05661080_03623 [Modestobacter sp. DSM 44400]
MTGPVVLTAAHGLSCLHGGTVAAAASDRLRVALKPVLIAPLEGKTVSGCTTPDAAGPPPTVKCRTVATVTAGALSRLTVRRVSVLLTGLVALTSGTPPPTGAPVQVGLGPTRLRAAVEP